MEGRHFLNAIGELGYPARCYEFIEISHGTELDSESEDLRKDTTRMNALSYAKVAKEGVDCDCGARIVMASPTRWARGTARIGGGAIMAASGSAAMADVEAARRGEGSGGLD